MSEGGIVCPPLWRGRNTMSVPASVPSTSGADGVPHGVSNIRVSRFSSPGMSYSPDPPITPNTALTMWSFPANTPLPNDEQ